MEFNLRPQWRLWNFYPSQQPMCRRCGVSHLYECNSFSKKCFKCGRYGHYARMCFTQKNNSITVDKPKHKSRACRKRDQERITKYLERKSFLHEMPFSNLRNTAFLNSLDVTNSIRSELQSVKLKLKEQQIIHSQTVCFSL